MATYSSIQCVKKKTNRQQYRTKCKWLIRFFAIVVFRFECFWLISLFGKIDGRMSNYFNHCISNQNTMACWICDSTVILSIHFNTAKSLFNYSRIKPFERGSFTSEICTFKYNLSTVWIIDVITTLLWSSSDTLLMVNNCLCKQYHTWQPHIILFKIYTVYTEN